MAWPWPQEKHTVTKIWIVVTRMKGGSMQMVQYRDEEEANAAFQEVPPGGGVELWIQEIHNDVYQIGIYEEFGTYEES